MKRVRAAGGAVWRHTSGVGLEVLVVHRPRYDDWSLPKGKAERGETDEDCAAREVEEETGYRCHVGPELATVEYVDRLGRPKVVRYWGMEAIEPPAAETAASAPRGPTGTVEVDEVRWMAVPDALERVSYDRDADVIARLVENAAPA